MQKHIKHPKSLRLDRETLRTLQEQDLQQAAGGLYTYPYVSCYQRCGTLQCTR